MNKTTELSLQNQLSHGILIVPLDLFSHSVFSILLATQGKIFHAVNVVSYYHLTISLLIKHEWL